MKKVSLPFLLILFLSIVACDGSPYIDYGDGPAPLPDSAPLVNDYPQEDPPNHTGFNAHIQVSGNQLVQGADFAVWVFTDPPISGRRVQLDVIEGSGLNGRLFVHKKGHTDGDGVATFTIRGPAYSGEEVLIQANVYYDNDDPFETEYANLNLISR